MQPEPFLGGAKNAPRETRSLSQMKNHLCRNYCTLPLGEAGVIAAA